MLNIDYTTIRDIQRNYKKISEEVNTEDVSFVVMGNNRPQFVIIGIKNFAKLHPSPKQNAGLSLLGLIDWAEENKIEGPEDLSEKHNEYLWDKGKK
jgi:hypothetical protein